MRTLMLTLALLSGCLSPRGGGVCTTDPILAPWVENGVAYWNSAGLDLHASCTEKVGAWVKYGQVDPSHGGITYGGNITINEMYKDINIRWPTYSSEIVAHEIGHSLGLMHSKDLTSVMEAESGHAHELPKTATQADIENAGFVLGNGSVSNARWP